MPSLNQSQIDASPIYSFGVHVVSSLVGQTFTQGASWYEEQLTLE